jgi:hypothetical protein
MRVIVVSSASSVNSGTRTIPHRRYQPAGVERRPRARFVPPAGLLGMIALALLVERSVARHSYELAAPVAYSWERCLHRAKTQSVGCEILIAGDSLTQTGLYTRIIEAGSGRKAMNLAVGGGPATLTSLMLRHAYDAGARPAAIVFDLKPSILSGELHEFAAFWPAVLSPLDLAAFSIECGHFRIAMDLMIRVFVPSIRMRSGLRDALVAWVNGTPTTSLMGNPPGHRNWEVNRGAHVGLTNGGFTGAITAADHEQFRANVFLVGGPNKSAARRILKQAIDHGARPYLFIPPFSPALHEGRISSGIEVAYSQFVRSLQEEFPTLTVLDARDSEYPATAFYDHTHVCTTGALPLSTDVAEILRADLEPEAMAEARRWVKLPTFRELPMPSGLETIEQSVEWIRNHPTR